MLDGLRAVKIETAGAETILATGTTLAYVVQLGELFLLRPASRFVLRRSSHCAKAPASSAFTTRSGVTPPFRATATPQ